MNSTEYVLAFPSFYKAAYAQETLGKNKIRSAIRKLPPGLLQSCGYGVILRNMGTDGLKRTLSLLEEKEIRPKGVFLTRREGERTLYDKVYL